ncbi:hypothetical protein WA026_012613 [Henosepilachna vigintioctopunctata]|uniref:Uncharacterized protein n=1 Tax=Henosepilachna vigintioctopunctata TaxID=420089 RepID=A0AAW1UAJ3_9CUCU
MHEIIEKNRSKDPPVEKKRQVQSKNFDEDEINIPASKNAQPYMISQEEKIYYARQKTTIVTALAFISMTSFSVLNPAKVGFDV